MQLARMEYNWLEWNTTGKNGMQLARMEYNWLEWNAIFK